MEGFAQQPQHNNNKVILGFVASIILIAGLATTLFLIRQQQDLRQHASTDTTAGVCKKQAQCTWDTVTGATSYNYTITDKASLNLSGTVKASAIHGNSYSVPFTVQAKIHYTCTVTSVIPSACNNPKVVAQQTFNPGVTPPITPPVTPVCTGSIVGKVIDDCSGKVLPITTANVTLTGHTVVSTPPDTYSIKGLCAGPYTLHFTAPSGYAPASQDIVVNVDGVHEATQNYDIKSNNGICAVTVTPPATATNTPVPTSTPIPTPTSIPLTNAAPTDSPAPTASPTPVVVDNTATSPATITLAPTGPGETLLNVGVIGIEALLVGALVLLAL